MIKVNVTGYLELQIDQVIEVTPDEYEKFIVPVEEDPEFWTPEIENFLITRLDHENIEDVFFVVGSFDKIEE